jgi:8-oxo-dGTP diphosphatase
VIEAGKGYFLPGGGVDSGESEVSALKRELLEEIGYQVSLLAEIGETVEYIKADGNEPYYQIRSRFYKVQLGRKEGESIEKNHHLIWLWPEEAIKRLTRRRQAWVVESMARG